jgi:hypothetical protein
MKRVDEKLTETTFTSWELEDFCNTYKKTSNYSHQANSLSADNKEVKLQKVSINLQK